MARDLARVASRRARTAPFSLEGTRGPGRPRWLVSLKSHPVNRRPFVSRNSVSESRSPPRRSASSVYVPVLCEPFMLARVTGYRAYVRCSLPTAGAARNLCFARARPGRRRQGRRWGMASYGLSAGLGGGAFLTHSKAALLAVFSDVQRSTTQRCRRDFADFAASAACLAARKCARLAHAGPW